MNSPTSDIEKEWLDIQNNVETCYKCGLHQEGIYPIFGEGTPRAKLIFIGEAPGATENKLKRPFVGASGKILNDLLKTIGYSREKVFISNIIKCRPPKNRDPSFHEINACEPYLTQQIELLHPIVIVTLGRFAARFFFKNFTSMDEIVGKVHNIKKKYLLLPMFHPATCLYNRQKYYPIFQQHFRVLQKLLVDEDIILNEEKRVGLDRFL